MVARNGGPAFVVRDIAFAVQPYGIRSTILTTNASNPAQAATPSAGATISDFPEGCEHLEIAIASLRQPYRFAFSPDLLVKAWRLAEEADVIHIHSLNLFPQLAAFLAATSRRKPFIVTPHGALDPWITARHSRIKHLNNAVWQQRMLRRAARLHFTTEAEAALATSQGVDTPTEILPIGSSSDHLWVEASGSDFRKQWLPGFTGPLILNHGRLSEKKGLDVLIEGFAQLKQPNVQLALVGPDEEGYGERLRALAASLGVIDRVAIVPPLTGPSLGSAILAADIWALPSHTENFGLSVVEAMAAKRAVVISPHVNLAADALAAGAAIVVNNTPEDFAREFSYLLADAPRRTELGERAASFAQRYRWESLGERYAQMYQSVARGGSR